MTRRLSVIWVGAVFAFAHAFLLLQTVAAKDNFDTEDRGHWAFQKVQRPAVSHVQHREWVRNPIDSFVLAELEAKQITPAPMANQRTLIRRAYLDLVGVPPSPEQIDAFLADRSPQAFERVVEELLDSPQYGER